MTIFARILLFPLIVAGAVFGLVCEAFFIGFDAVMSRLLDDRP